MRNTKCWYICIYVGSGLLHRDRSRHPREGLTFFADPTKFRSEMDSDFALYTARRMVRSSQIGVRDFHDDTARYYVILFLLNGPRAEDNTMKFLAVLDRFHSRYKRRV